MLMLMMLIQNKMLLARCKQNIMKEARLGRKGKTCQSIC